MYGLKIAGKAKKKNVLFPVTRPCVPKCRRLKLFLGRFSTSKTFQPSLNKSNVFTGT